MGGEYEKKKEKKWEEKERKRKRKEITCHHHLLEKAHRWDLLFSLPFCSPNTSVSDNS